MSPESAQTPRRLIDAPTMACFLAALRRGARRAEAAHAVGFHLNALQNARVRDPLFRLAWGWAEDLVAADLSAARNAATSADEDEDGVPIRYASQGGRILQRRRMSWLRFTPERQRRFLDHFAGTADAGAAAQAAGVCIQTVNNHRRRDPEFAPAYQEALELAYLKLQAEALRQRHEARQRLRDGLMPEGEMSEDFDRVMQLLRYWKRRDGGLGPRPAGLRGRSWTFDEAMELLEKKMLALGVKIEEPVEDGKEHWPPPPVHRLSR